MELKRYFRILVSWWWLVVVSMVVVTAASFVFDFTQMPRYRSTLTLLISPKTTITELSAVRQSLDTLDKPSIINTYAEVINSQKIYDQAVESLNLPDTPVNHVNLTVTVIQKTNLIRIDAEGANPQAVYQVANRVAEMAVKYIDDLYELYDIQVLDPAVLPTTPFSPDFLRDTGLGAALGLVFGVSMSFTAEYLKKPLEAMDPFLITDRESGLYNRRYFLHRLREEIHRSKRNQQSLAFCLIHLKNVENNPANSKEVERLIRNRAFLFLKRHIRQGEILARWDDANLAWLLLDTSEAATQQAISRLGGLIEQKSFEDEETGEIFNYAGAFGAAISRGDLTERELIATTENALHQARQNSIDGIRVISKTEAALE